MTKKLIVGLGNPGAKYVNTRHNAGFVFVDELAEQYDCSWKNNKSPKYDTCSFTAGDLDITLLKPQTYMNLSGAAVKGYMDYAGIQANSLLVVHDDVDLEKMHPRLKKNMSAGGHRGVSDIINSLGTQDFYRLKLGVGRPENHKFDVEDYVLSKLTDEEVDFIKRFARDFDFTSY